MRTQSQYKHSSSDKRSVAFSLLLDSSPNADLKFLILTCPCGQLQKHYHGGAIITGGVAVS